MQLFVTHPSPYQCAFDLDDSRVIKQALETMQMLSTVAHLEGHKTQYKPSHPHNGLIRWLQNDRANVYWTIAHGAGLLSEYSERFGRQHASEDVLWDMMKIFGYQKKEPLAFINKAANKEHGIDFTHVEDVHTAYKLYLDARWMKSVRDHELAVKLGLLRKPRKPKWTNKKPPNWWSMDYVQS